MKIIKGILKYANTNRIALICDGEKTSYRDLNKYSDVVSNYLKSIHGNDTTPIVVYGNKENLIMSCFIGALKSGRAYVPVDISFPLDRVLQIIDDVKPKVIFDFSGTLKIQDSNVINLESLKELINNKNYQTPLDSMHWVKDDENAYILFTSGSTGKPKGVQISSNNLDSFVNWISPCLKLNGEPKVVLNQAAYSFDLSVTSIYPGLVNGCTLFAISKSTMENYKLMFTQLEKSNVNIWVSTPTFAGVCSTDSSFNNNLLKSLESMIFIGEVLPKNLAEKLLTNFPTTRVINGYGPTEATVGVSANDITKEYIDDECSLPVGYPMENCTIKIVDSDGYEVMSGEKGEIVIIGQSVSKGYFNNETKTNESFFYDSFKGNKCRAYKTGDLAYIRDGRIYYCGRIDFQIKLNGYRIEIEDIENNLRKLENIKNAIVIPIYKNEKIAYLKGIVELCENNDFSDIKNAINIKKQLSKYLPSYMIPRNISIIDEFPTNINGKIDRKKMMEEN